jgi:hypothetical protein
MKKEKHLYQLDLFENTNTSPLLNEVILSTFNVSKKAMMNSLLYLWKIYRKRSKLFAKIEIITYEKYVILNMSQEGYYSEQQIYCEPCGFVKAIVHLEDIQSAVQNSSSSELTIIVQEKIIAVNGRRMAAEIEKINPKTNLLEHKLKKLNSLNSQALEYYKGADGKMNFHMHLFLNDVTKVTSKLNKYGFSYDEVKEFMLTKVTKSNIDFGGEKSEESMDFLWETFFRP